MLSGEPRVPVHVLRAAIREAAERPSANAVAREIGISTRSLLDFIHKETQPRASTLRKYTMWYIQYRHRIGGGMDTHIAAAALDFIVEHIPAAKRADAKSAFLAWIEQASSDAGVELPEWAGELKVESRSE